MHTIRLRGPWRVEPVERFVLQRGWWLTSARALSLPAAATMTMPADWAAVRWAPIFLGRVRYRRIFQKPTGLESGERVWLVVERPRSRAVCRAKQQAIGRCIAGEPLGGLILRNCWKITIGWRFWCRASGG